MSLVRKQTLPTERPPLVDKVSAKGAYSKDKCVQLSLQETKDSLIHEGDDEVIFCLQFSINLFNLPNIIVNAVTVLTVSLLYCTNVLLYQIHGAGGS